MRYLYYILTYIITHTTWLAKWSINLLNWQFEVDEAIHHIIDEAIHHIIDEAIHHITTIVGVEIEVSMHACSQVSCSRKATNIILYCATSL